MKQIQIQCDECGKKFLRNKKEVRRSIRMHRKQFCNLSCSMSHMNKTLDRSYCYKNIFARGKLVGRQKDEFSKFRLALSTARARSKSYGKEFNITLETLKKQWEVQNGICPYTGIKLNLYCSNEEHKKGLYTASLDRVDSSKGYIEGNIQFVSFMINMSKNNLQENELIEFCRCIANKWKQ